MTVEQAEKALKVGMKVADECIDKVIILISNSRNGNREYYIDRSNRFCISGVAARAYSRKGNWYQR